MLGKTGLHAVKALAALAQAEPGTYVGAATLSEQIRSPRNYLGKLLQALARAGLVEGQKGLNGGFRLSRKPDQVSLFEVVAPLEAIERWNGCFLTHGACRDQSPCRVHERWARVRESYLRFLKETSILDVADGSAVGALARRPLRGGSPPQGRSVKAAKPARRRTGT